MALKEYQEELQLDTLYEVSKRGDAYGTEQLAQSLSIDSGGVSVYGYNGATQPTSLAGMTLNTENVDVQGIVSFSLIPRYIYVTQTSGTTTELVATGLEIKDLGGF